MSESNLAYYLHKFGNLRTDRTGGWKADTKGIAPHKPLLLLSVLNLFAQGHMTANLIEITPELVELFGTYWSSVMHSRATRQFSSAQNEQYLPFTRYKKQIQRGGGSRPAARKEFYSPATSTPLLSVIV